jgi:glycosyltransferase involved in cell wall biosynthesis
MIDIILLTCNRLKLLQQIIAGFEERLDVPYRLIVVNNNSKDGTTKYLEGLN